MRTAVLSITSILLSASLALAEPDPGRLQVLAKPLAEVPFTLHQNAVILEAQLNGRDSIRLLLDTGWGPLALGSTAAQRLGLQYKSSAGGLPRVEVESLAIGGAIKRDVVFEIFPAEELMPLIGPHDGVLSTAFFKDLVLEIDYLAGVVRFYESSPIPQEPPREPGARTSVPMVFSPRAGTLPFTDSVLLDGKPVRVLFDTGGSGGFMAMQQLVDRARLEVLPDTGGPKIAIGMLSNGQATQQIVKFARVGRIALGSLVVESPRVMIAPSQLEGGDWGHDLNIGYGFMRSYVVTFDYPNKLITFERPSSLPAQSLEGENVSSPKSQSIESGYAPVNGIKMYYEMHGRGDGIPLVLLHGGGSTIDVTFGKVLPFFASSRRVIAVEEQGHGRTTDRDAPFRFDSSADDVAALLEFLEVDEADIFGFSNGASVALQVAIRHPHLVRRMVFASSITKRDGAHPQLWEFMKQADFSNMPQALKDAFLQVNPDVQQLRTMHDKDAERMQNFEDVPDELIRSVHAPTLILLGDQDIVKPEHALELKRLVSGARLLVLPGGHGDYLGEAVTTQKDTRYPELTAGIIEEFLDGSNDE